MFFKIVALKNFAKFTGKHPCWSLFLIELQACLLPVYSNSYQKQFLKLAKLRKKDNISICFSKTLTLFCGVEELRNETVSLPFEERIKATTLRKFYGF